MMVLLVLLIGAQFFLGCGIAVRLQAVRTTYSLIGLSMLIGLGVSSFVPFIVQFSGLPIVASTVIGGVVGLAILSVFSLRSKKERLPFWAGRNDLAISLYEIPFLIVWLYLLFISVWKCNWFPNTTFDTIVGPDLLARFAVQEQTLVSSVFTKHLPNVSVFSNQPFYAPFTAMQQIMYLLATEQTGVFAFGKLWLTLLVFSFGLFLYADMRERIHPVLAGTLVTILAFAPELFAYTFLVQTDWANAAFFASGVILFQRYVETGQNGSFWSITLLLALACWTRTETIFFVPIGAMILVIKRIRVNPTDAIKQSAIFMLVCLLPVLFWNYGFLRTYMPLPINAHLGAFRWVETDYLTRLLRIVQNMNDRVVFHASYWNYTVPIFLSLSLLNLFIFRDKRGLTVLVWIVGVYVLFAMILQHVEGANIQYTFRRGFFKLLFLMCFYLSTTSLFRWLSIRLVVWEKTQTVKPAD
ncbi:hypothetical protein GCM10028806_30780 [Spirosoma terrae]|uniref:Glycosyltransferase family 39 protein n=1 Tax=Spirosoma terrae TaxID=1968276 RepID=A0A6L9L7R8_9BACT|nr:glycosyltransferase family 39 protein [Spirosoma terrae]NDU95392.1 glycosyltransferase family 39 protein [Spirosoma terrae]